jgi:hypothetical protein
MPQTPSGIARLKKTTKKGGRSLLFRCCQSIAAAAKNDEGDNDDPAAVITKQVSKTVVHKRSSLQSLERGAFSPSISFYAKAVERCRKNLLYPFCR